MKSRKTRIEISPDELKPGELFVYNGVHYRCRVSQMGPNPNYAKVFTRRFGLRGYIFVLRSDKVTVRR